MAVWKPATGMHNGGWQEDRENTDPARAMRLLSSDDVLRITEGVGERQGSRGRWQMVPPTARSGTCPSLFLHAPALGRAEINEARARVPPTPSVVDRGRRCRNAIAIRLPRFDTHRPV